MGRNAASYALVIEAPQAGEQVSIHPIDFAPIYGYGRVS
jgi:hypothetical protein